MADSKVTDLQSSLEHVLDLSENLKVAFKNLIELCTVEDRFSSDSAVVVISSQPFRWGPLSSDGSIALGAAREVLDNWLESMKLAFQHNAPEFLPDLEKANKFLMCFIDRSDNCKGPPSNSIERMVIKVNKSIDKQLEKLRSIVSTSFPKSFLLIPDTNVLLMKPDLHLWNPDVKLFTIVVMPQIMRELDGHKVHHSNPNVRSKARKLINQFYEYERRGDTFKGVKYAKVGDFRTARVCKLQHTQNRSEDHAQHPSAVVHCNFERNWAPFS